MSLLDLLLAIILLTSVIAGFVAGFARMGIGLLATILGVLFGFWFHGMPAVWVKQWVTSPIAANLLGFFIVFLVFQLAGALLAKLIAKFFKWTGLSWLDRLAGGIFGVVRGALICAAFVTVTLAFAPKPPPNWMVDSKLLPYALSTSDMVAALAPSSIKDAFRESLNDIREIWKAQLRKGREKLQSVIPLEKKQEKSKEKSR